MIGIESMKLLINKRKKNWTYFVNILYPWQNNRECIPKPVGTVLEDYPGVIGIRYVQRHNK